MKLRRMTLLALVLAILPLDAVAASDGDTDLAPGTQVRVEAKSGQKFLGTVSASNENELTIITSVPNRRLSIGAGYSVAGSSSISGTSFTDTARPR